MKFIKNMKSKIFSKILITGANGCLGKKLSNYLLKKQNLQILNLIKNNDNLNNLNNDNFIFSDIRDIENVKNKLKNIDVVIHLAFPNNTKSFSKKKIEELVSINNNFFNLMCSLKVKKFIYMSTAKIKNFELSMNKNINNYETCKLQIENNLLKLSKSKATKLIIVRSGIVYGPEIENNFKKFIGYVKSGKKIPLIKKNVFKNIIYINFFLKGVDFIIKSNHVKSKIIYLYERNIKLSELIYIINHILKRKNNILVIPKYILMFIKIFRLEGFLFKSLFDSFYIKEKSFYKIDEEYFSNTNFKENLKNTYNLI